MPEELRIKGVWIGLLLSAVVGVGGWIWNLAVANQIQAAQQVMVNDHETRIRDLEKAQARLIRIEDKIDQLKAK